MSPVDPSADLYDMRVDAYHILAESFEYECNRPLLEVNLKTLLEMDKKLCNVPESDESDDESDEVTIEQANSNRFRTIMFTCFLVHFAQELNTLTPNWIKVLTILHDMRCSFPGSEEIIAFWSISYGNDNYQRKCFTRLACHQYSDDLINSNQTGVSLERIINSYSITIKLCRLDSMCNSTLTTKVVHMFINHLYFDEYFNRNELVMIENESIPFSLYNEDGEYYFDNGGQLPYEFDE